MKVISYAELNGAYSSVFTFLKSRQLYDVKNSLVFSTVEDSNYHYHIPEEAVSLYLFACDGYLYLLIGINNDFSLQRVTDTRLYENVRAHAHRLGDEYPIINLALLNFERKAANIINPKPKI